VRPQTAGVNREWTGEIGPIPRQSCPICGKIGGLRAAPLYGAL